MERELTMSDANGKWIYSAVNLNDPKPLANRTETILGWVITFLVGTLSHFPMYYSYISDHNLADSFMDLRGLASIRAVQDRTGAWLG